MKRACMQKAHIIQVKQEALKKRILFNKDRETIKIKGTQVPELLKV